MSEKPFYKYQRKLPHWRESNATYFVTWRLHENQGDLSPEERSLVVSALRYFENQRYQLYCFVIMNDHVHVIVRPIKECPLHKIIHSWKSYSANQMCKQYKRKAAIWQAESFDRILRNEKEFLQKADYIYKNPFNRWPEIQDYDWYGIGFQEI